MLDHLQKMRVWFDANVLTFMLSEGSDDNCYYGKLCISCLQAQVKDGTVLSFFVVVVVVAIA